MTDTALATWIKKNLGPIISECLTAAGTDHFTEDLLGGMAQRETGIKMHPTLAKNPSITVAKLSELMMGDYGQRQGEVVARYHGFGFWQIDIKSFPEFVASGDWKDPHKCCAQAIRVLESKRKYLSDKLPGLTGEAFERATVAAYNCGEGRVMRAILAHQDPDTMTFGKDYVAAVWRYRHLYNQAG